MGLLLKRMGKLEEARPLLGEALQSRRDTLGDRHRHTLISIGTMSELMQEMDQLEGAKTLLEEALKARRKTLGDRHRHTLISICTMGELLHAMAHGPAEEGEADARRGVAGAEGDAGRQPPAHAEHDWLAGQATKAEL